MLSMAFATNNTALGQPSETPAEIVVDTEAVFNLDQYGIKPKQDIEEDFKLIDTGFTNLKSKKRQGKGSSEMKNSVEKVCNKRDFASKIGKSSIHSEKG